MEEGARILLLRRGKPLPFVTLPSPLRFAAVAACSSEAVTKKKLAKSATAGTPWAETACSNGRSPEARCMWPRLRAKAAGSWTLPGAPSGCAESPPQRREEPAPAPPPEPAPAPEPIDSLTGREAVLAWLKRLFTELKGRRGIDLDRCPSADTVAFVADGRKRMLPDLKKGLWRVNERQAAVTEVLASELPPRLQAAYLASLLYTSANRAMASVTDEEDSSFQKALVQRLSK